MSLTTLSACAPPPRRVQIADVLPYLRGRIVAPSSPAWPAKDPVQTTLRQADFAAVLRGRGIQAVRCTASGVNVVGSRVDGGVVTVALQGGGEGVTARVEIAVHCSDGTDEVAAILLPIVSQITMEAEMSDVSLSPQTSQGVAPLVLGPIAILASQGSSVRLVGNAVTRNPATGDTVTWDVSATIKGFATTGATVSFQVEPQFTADTALAGVGLSVSVTASSVYLVCTGLLGLSLIWSGSVAWTAA